MMESLLETLKPYLLPEIPEEQVGLVLGWGTREQIPNERQFIKYSNESNVSTYVCFTNYSKIFECFK